VILDAHTFVVAVNDFLLLAGTALADHVTAAFTAV
jgi:hypothetical protein